MQDRILNVCFTYTIAPHGYDLLSKAHFKNHLELQAHPPGQNGCKDLSLFQEKRLVCELYAHTFPCFFCLQAEGIPLFRASRSIKIFQSLVLMSKKELNATLLLKKAKLNIRATISQGQFDKSLW